MTTSSLSFGWAALALLLAVLPAAAESAAAGPPVAVIEKMRADLAASDPDGAIAIGEAEVAKDGSRAELWRWLGRSYGAKIESASLLSKLGVAQKCRGAYEKAVALDPQNAEARGDLAQYYIEAPSIAGGSAEKARVQTAKVLEMDPVRGHILLGEMHAHDKEMAAAEAEFRKALDLDRQSLLGTLSLASFYVGQKRWREAAALWQRRLEADAGDLMAHYQLARIALVSGTSLDEAIAHLKAYLTVPAPSDHPTWADAHWRLGLVYEKLGRKEEAKAELREALKLNPRHPKALKDLERLGG